jgi:hypothetical protein
MTIAGQPRQCIARRQIARQAAGDGQQHRIAERQADGFVDLFEPVDVDHQDDGNRRAWPSRSHQRCFEPVEKQFAVWQAGQIVMHRVMQHALLGGFDFGNVGQSADDAHDLAVGIDDRPRLHDEPEIMAVGRAQPDVVVDAAATLLQKSVERRLVAVAVHRMQHVQPRRRGTFQGAALQSKLALDLRTDVNLVEVDVPVEYGVAAAGHGQRAALGIGASDMGDRRA